eukprot:1339085-Prymnesium_polylepis.1
MVVPGAYKRCAGVAINVLSPKVAAFIVGRKAARHAVAQSGGQLLSPRQVRLVSGRALRLAIRDHGEDALERMLSQCRIGGQHGVALP